MNTRNPHVAEPFRSIVNAFSPRVPKIVTRFVYPPIPIRTCDWEAFYDGDEPNDAGCMEYGSGETEAEAIRDLTENYPRET